MTTNNITINSIIIQFNDNLYNILNVRQN